MADPTLCFLLPTVGRPELVRMLCSIAEQDLVAGDEVLLVSDDRHEACATVWTAAGLPGRHIPLADGPHQDWGHTPRNRTLPLARADYIFHVDDDDVLLPGAVARIRAALRCHPSDFHLFPFIRHRDRHLVGSEGILAHGYVGTPNLIHPRTVVTGEWGTIHGGDAQFITSTVARNPDRAIHWHAHPHYYAYPPPTFSLSDCYAAGYQVARAHDPAYRLLPVREKGISPTERGRDLGGKDRQDHWRTLAANLFVGNTVLDVEIEQDGTRDIDHLHGCLTDSGFSFRADPSGAVVNLPSGAVEVAMAISVLARVNDDRGFIEQLLRAASRAVFLTTSNWWASRSANPRHGREYTPSQLLALLDGLPVVQFWVGDRRGTTAQEVHRSEFVRHTEPYQAVLLSHSHTDAWG